MNGLNMVEKMPTKEMLDCMKHCCECAGMCGQCAAHCLHLGGEHASADHQGLMRDCQEMCSLAECFMARASEHCGHVCAECAEICSLCAAGCDKLGNGDAMMAKCAEACRACEIACRAVVGTYK